MKIAKWSRMLFILSLLIMTALMVAACQPASPTAEGSTSTGADSPQAPAPIVTVTEVAGPYIKISDQAIPNKRVILDESWSEVAGWLVIYNDKDGKANEVIGYGSLAKGRNMNSQIKADITKATETLHAIIHLDVGKVSIFEFPGVDEPYLFNGNPVETTFKVTGGLP